MEASHRRGGGGGGTPKSPHTPRSSDKVVFGPSSQQKDLYDQAVWPIVFEVLEGYNCTIFAYGQTGTGKTYTMEGGARKKNGEIPSDAGVIPRAVKQIFDILEAQNAEYSMKVTFLELYNEEITDLLAPEEYPKFIEDKSKKPIALMEDGKGGVVVRGLEEEIVTTANEIYKILEKGSAKRRTAETLLNKQSSRSHSVFSITIHMKEGTPEGEEMIKCGKLNLVDLAGSENISRSGAREGRAREAGEINKSLLTLGRVINAWLSIRVMYPTETLNTLDYAHRAKHIKNKPEINQKMMKSALIKDLYFEIDRLKQEVYAAREKNGIYIPKDRYLQDEAEKKAMSEKIERMEIDLESRDKRAVELQELYNSQQQLTVELSDKLEKTEKKLQETEHSLIDLEERHRQANATIKEKEYLISNLLNSEKSLVERALELRSELESAASDVSNLFNKIERKDKIEDGNRVLVQKFQSQLTQQLEVLHKAVASSTTQQEQQLKEMEEDMHSFVSTKTQATEELRGHLEKLKTIYGSGIKALDNLAGELDGITSEANTLLHDLQDSLHCHENKLTAYAQQQREAHTRTIETTRSISQTTANFFKTLDRHASKLGHIVEEAQTTNDEKLSELEKKFEVQCAVGELRDNAASRTNKLQQEMSIIQDTTSSIKAEWTNYTKRAESDYLEDTAKVENGKEEMEDVLRKCLEQAKRGAQQWNNAQGSVLGLEKRNIASVDGIVREGMDTIQVLRERFSSAVNSALENAEFGSKSMLSSIDRSLQLDHEACGNIDSLIGPCCGDLRELNSGHHHKMVEITEHAGKCLLQDYMVDQPSCSTPRKRPINLPSIGSIEELRTPSFEELLKSFWDAKSSKQANGDTKHFSEAFRDPRLPLTAIN
ncbi:UNVERIFIED_CONTAM: Kinesin-like protein KIN-5D [Sesamum calycinum]|uniref:Kinesin-like protein n=1 Tax=Sesamum calycinum TaxID=2727403 RepID=A0AAW2JEV2_9LAMI